MMTFLLVVIAVVAIAAFVSLWLWTRRIERDDVEWEHGAHADDDEARATQFGIAANVNGTYSR